jgi:lipopolysaccharide/colanic/teichoic acid biosynthesis glycosyltransferase
MNKPATPAYGPWPPPRTCTIYARYGKRLFDLGLTVPGTVLISPLLAVLAALVRATSGKPVFFRQERVGRGGRVFHVFKFRTMIVGAVNHGRGYYLEDNDPRITRIGHFLRATSLDELPQVLNVIAGDMSLVGPRPNLTFIVQRYGHRYDTILTVKPGLTCLVAIRGRNRLRRSQMIAFDDEYVDRLSFWTDIKILAETLPAVILRRGSTNDVGEEWMEDVEPAAPDLAAEDRGSSAAPSGSSAAPVG